MGALLQCEQSSSVKGKEEEHIDVNASTPELWLEEMMVESSHIAMKS